MKRIISCVVLAMLAAWAAAWAAAPGAAVVPAQSVEAAVAAGPHANQIILTPVADTYVAKGYDEPNPSGNLKVGYRNEADYIILVKFELPRTVMGTGATITSAELRFFCHESDVELGNSSDLDIAVASRDWDEKTVTYKTKPNETGPKASWAIEECTSKWVNTKDSEGIAETLAEVVQTWYDDEDKNYGWTIGPKNLRTESMFTFQSREGQEGQPMPLSLAPKLYFTYESGVTATFTPSSTPTVTDTPTPTNTPTPTDTPTPTNTPTPSDTPTPTNTPTNTPTPSNTPEATLTPTPAKLYMPIVLREFDLFAPVPEMALGDQGPMTGDPAAVAAGSDWRDIARVFFGTRRR